MSAGSISVSPVRDEAAMELFLRLPWGIYRDDPYWVPPLLPQQREFLDPRRGPFFEIGEAQYFLALRDGAPAGRISAHVNRLHDDYYGPETGFFGFFECIPDQEVAAALFAAAGDWLRAKGKTRLVGPLNFAIYDEMGLLVEGFDFLPVIFQTHNPPYYQDLLTSLGFAGAMDWYALKSTRDSLHKINMPEPEKLLDRIMSGPNANLKFTPFRLRDLNRWAPEVHALFNESWSRNWGHIPIARKQFDKLLVELRPLLRPELVNLVVDGDRLVAFGITIPDLNPLVQKLNGRLTLWGKLRLFYEAKYRPVRKVRALVLGVHQPYQARRLHLAMILRTYLYLVRQTPCETVDMSLIPANLTQYMKSYEAFGARRYKVFRVFEKPL